MFDLFKDITAKEYARAGIGAVLVIFIVWYFYNQNEAHIFTNVTCYPVQLHNRPTVPVYLFRRKCDLWCAVVRVYL